MKASAKQDVSSINSGAIIFTIKIERYLSLQEETEADFGGLANPPESPFVKGGIKEKGDFKKVKLEGERKTRYALL